MIIGCYVLHLCCDDPRHDTRLMNQEEFTAETASGARAEARRAGWVIDMHEDKAFCRVHAPMRRK